MPPGDLIFYAARRLVRWYERRTVADWKRRFEACGRKVDIEYPCHIWSPERMRVGDDVCIHRFTHIFAGGGLEIGDGVQISSNCSITTLGHVIDPILGPRPDAVIAPVRIGRGAWIGTGAILLPGVTVGERAVVGAGAVVTADVPPATVAVGVPARARRHIDGRAYSPGQG